MDFSQLLFLLGNVLGMIAKAKGFNAKLIPAAILAQQLLVRLVEGIISGGGPVDPAPAGVAVAGVVLASVWGGIGSIFWAALRDTIVAVGLHSVGKNTRQGLTKP